MSIPVRRTTFPVSLFLATNPDTGEEFLVRTAAEIGDEARLALADYRTQLSGRVAAGELKQEGADKLLAQFVAHQGAYIARATSDMDEARTRAERFDFVLQKPFYGELESIRSEATAYDFAAGGERWDERKYRHLLLAQDGVKYDGKVLTPQEIDALPPAIADELGFRLARAIQPDQKRLLFTSPPA